MSSRTIVIVLVSLSSVISPAQAIDNGLLPSAGNHTDQQDEPTVVIVMKDCSGSYGDLPPDTSQAFVTQLIRLADLSRQPVKLGVILFGGGGVTVLGDESGMPTAAYESLHQLVLDEWPKPSGGTPLEEAMERCVGIVKAIPPNTKILVVLFSDGRPASGDLQPDRYPAVREEIDRRLTSLQTRYQGNAPAFVQNIVSRAEVAMQTPDTDAWEELMALQIKAETEKTIEHAAALKEAGVRLLSVDYTSGLPELKQIQEAAGGKTDDYVHATPPSVIIPKLHALGLTALPRVIVQHPKSSPADLTAFDATWTAEFDSVGEAVLVTALFDPPIPSFARNATLEAVFDGKTRTFTPDNRDSELLLSFDSADNVVAATVALDTLPKDGQLSLHYTSPSATLHVPGCTLYTHLRMAADLRAEFRPVHLPDNARPTFRISPNHALTFESLLRSDTHPQPYPIASIEPVLRDRFNGREVRIAMKEDPQRKNVFVSDNRRLIRGNYDLELNIVLSSGARIVLRESSVIECQARNEFIAVEIPLPAGGETESTSANRAHLDFGNVGDAVMECRIPIVIRAMNIDYPITLAPSVVGLADEDGTSPHDRWIAFNRDEITLEPGEPQPVVVTLRVPDAIEESIRDGRFEGRLVFERLDVRQPVPLRRYNKIAGVADDEPVEPVAFTLLRPEIVVSAPRGPRDAIKKRPAGETLLPIPVSIWHPFARRVILDVRHTSILPRDITTLSQATFADGEGRKIPSVRLVLDERCELTQEVESGDSARWIFTFEIDDDETVSKAFGSIVVSGPGLRPLYIPVEVGVRNPLLGRAMKAICFGLAGLFLLLAGVAAVKFLSARRQRTGRTFRYACGQTLPHLLEFTTKRGEPKVKLKKDAIVGYAGQAPVHFRANQTLPKEALRELSRDEPCTIVADGREIHLTHLYQAGDRYDVCGRFAKGGRLDAISHMQRQKSARYLVRACALSILGYILFHPVVLATTQWALDVLSLS